jgi:DNA-binding SARP family transcriptional activator
MVRIHVLGRLSVEGDDGNQVALPSSRRARALLAWLAVHPGGRSRSQAAGVFWPGIPEASARTSLRGALAELRRSLGPADVFQAGREQIALDPDRTWVDLQEFQAHLAAGRWADALALDRGRLLADLDDDWAHRRREEHTHDVLRVLTHLAAEHERAGRTREALAVAQRRVRLDPLSEDAGRELVRLLAASGDRAAALDAGRSLADRLQRELGIGPSAATAAMLDGLRRTDPALRSVASPVAAPRPSGGHPVVSGPSAPGVRDLLPPELIGRDEVLATLAAIRRAPMPAALMVRGGAGIGKTSVVAAAAVAGQAEGALVLYGRCDEEAIVPYCPWVEALGPVIEQLDDVRRRAIVAEGGADLARLFPMLARDGLDLGPGHEADTERWRLFEAITRLLAELAAARTVLVVLDDLHWADRSTMSLLRHVLRTSQDAALAFILTARGSEAARDAPMHEVVRQLQVEGSLTMLDLPGLTREDVARLAHSHADRDDWTGFVTALWEETEGNPFFIKEILRNLAPSGAWRSDDERPFEVPEGVRELLRRRLSRLGDDVMEVLAWASVVGRSFSFRVLTACCPLPDERVLDALDLAVEARLVEEHGVGHYSFAHALVRSTLYDGLSRTRRARLHALVAQALETGDRPGRVIAAELAHHYLASGDPAHLDVAIGYARQASAEALAQLAYGEAAAMTRRAVSAVRRLRGDDQAQLGPLLLELGDALSRSGDRVGARIAYLDAAAAARQEQQPNWLGTAALGYAGPSWQGFGTVDSVAIGLLEEALEALPEERVALRTRLQARLAVELYFARRPEQVLELTETALSTARELGDPAVLAAALEARLWARWRPDGIADRVALADGETSAVARRWRLVALLEAGRLDEVWAEAARHEEEVRRLGLPYEQMYVAVFATMRALLEGRLEDAQAASAHVTTFGELRGGADALQLGGVHALTLAVLAGRVAEIVEPIRGFVEAYPAIPAWRGALATALAAAGRVDEAATEVELVWPPEEVLPFDAVQVAGFCFLAMAVSILGDADKARHLYDALLPYARRPVVLGAGGAVLGTVDLFLAQLAAACGDRDTADRHLETAAEDLAAAGSDIALLVHPAGAPETFGVTPYGVIAPFTMTARSTHAGGTRAAEASVMPTPTTLLFFVASTLALLAVPGPSVVYVVTRTLEQGRRAGLVSMLGLETGALAHVALSALGVTALLAASDWAFVVVKYAVRPTSSSWVCASSGAARSRRARRPIHLASHTRDSSATASWSTCSTRRPGCSSSPSCRSSSSRDGGRSPSRRWC